MAAWSSVDASEHDDHGGVWRRLMAALSTEDGEDDEEEELTFGVQVIYG